MVPSLVQSLDEHEERDSVLSDEAQNLKSALVLLDSELADLDLDHRLTDRIAKPILQRAQQHLAARLQRYLIPKHFPETEAHARELIGELAKELEIASKHLSDISGWMLANGHGKHATTAKKAAQQALRATEGLVD